jgi:hypothetical protein
MPRAETALRADTLTIEQPDTTVVHLFKVRYAMIRDRVRVWNEDGEEQVFDSVKTTAYAKAEPKAA